MKSRLDRIIELEVARMDAALEVWKSCDYPLFEFFPPAVFCEEPAGGGVYRYPLEDRRPYNWQTDGE